MALEFAHSLGNIGRSSTEADAPACHRIGLRHTIDDDYTILHLGEGGDGRGLSTIADMFINLVGNDDDFRILGKYLNDSRQFLLGVDGTRRIGGRAEEESLGAWSDEAFELVGQNLEVLLLAAKEGYVDAIGQFYHFEIAHPCRGGDNHFITLVND